MELGPLSIKKWDAGEKNGEIGQFLAELVFWLSCKISFFTISNHTNGAAELVPPFERVWKTVSEMSFLSPFVGLLH